MLCRCCTSSILTGVGDQVFGVRGQSAIQHGAGNCLVVEQRLALRVPSGGERQIAFDIAQEDVSAFGARQFQRGIDQRHQDFIEHADGVELARRFHEERELFEIAGFGGDLDARDLAEKLARRVRSGMQRMEDQVGNIARAKFQPVVALQLVAVHLLAIDEGAVFAAKVHDKKLAIFRNDRAMLARHARVGDHQVAIHLAAHGIGSVIQRQRLLIVALYKDRDGKDAGYARVRRSRHVR